MKNYNLEALLTRLFEILKRLNRGEKLSVLALSKEFGVSSRTIQRDFNERLASLPLAREGKLIKLAKVHTKAELEEWEENITRDLLISLAEKSGENFGKRVKKLLKKAVQPKLKPLFNLHFTNDIDSKYNEIKIIEEAIANQKLVRFFYTVADVVQSVTVIPLKIVFVDGLWMLAASDQVRGGLKLYKLSEIGKSALMVDSFKKDKSLEKQLENILTSKFDPDAKPMKATLKASKFVAKELLENPILASFKLLSIEDDESVIFTLEYTHEMEILPIIGYFLGEVEIEKPTELKTNLQKYLKRIVD